MDGEQRTYPIHLLAGSRANLRQDLGDLTELVESIRANGILQPLLITSRRGAPEVVDGNRRLAAARLAGLEEVPVYERVLSHRQYTTAMLVTAIQRRSLTPCEEAAGYQQLIDMDMSQRAVAEAVGCTQANVSRKLALLQLPEEARGWVDTGGISIANGVELAGLPEDEQTSCIAEMRADPSQQQWRISASRRRLEATVANEARDKSRGRSQPASPPPSRGEGASAPVDRPMSPVVEDVNEGTTFPLEDVPLVDSGGGVEEHDPAPTTPETVASGGALAKVLDALDHGPHNLRYDDPVISGDGRSFDFAGYRVSLSTIETRLSAAHERPIIAFLAASIELAQWCALEATTTHQELAVEGGDVEGDASVPDHDPQRGSGTESGDGADSQDAGDVPTGGELRHVEVGEDAAPSPTALTPAELAREEAERMLIEGGMDEMLARATVRGWVRLHLDPLEEARLRSVISAARTGAPWPNYIGTPLAWFEQHVPALTDLGDLRRMLDQADEQGCSHDVLGVITARIVELEGASA